MLDKVGSLGGGVRVADALMALCPTELREVGEPEGFADLTGLRFKKEAGVELFLATVPRIGEGTGDVVVMAVFLAMAIADRGSS